MKTKPPKMTKADKLAQHAGSRFIRVIPSHKYAEYLYSKWSEHKYDKQGRRVR
jgi:hypothetical protein